MFRSLTVLCIAIFCGILAGCSPQNEQSIKATATPESAPTATATPAPKLALYIREPRNPGADASFGKEGKERLKILNSFTQAAGKLAREYGTPRHNEVVLFAVGKAQLLMPVRMDNGNPNMVPYSPRMKDKPLGILVLKPEDAEIGGFFQRYLAGKAGGGAMYQPEGERGSMLLSRELAGSEEGMALSFLHESFHVWQHLKEGKGSAQMSPQEFSQGEVEAHEFVGQVVDRKYPAVAKLVAETAKLAEGKNDGKTATVVSSVAIRTFVDERLDAAYGRTIPEGSERGSLRMDVIYRANFKVFDKLFPKEERLEEKARWVQWYLESVGAAQWQAPNPGF